MKREEHIPTPKVVVCECGLAVKTSCEEYFCPTCGRHIVDLPPKRCSLCAGK